MKKYNVLQKEKRCFKCRVTKHLGEFYRHPQMPDGHINKCKECTKGDVRKWQAANPERMAENDRRWKAANRDKVRRSDARMRAKYPLKIKARRAVNYAVRSGKLIRPDTCSSCGAGGRIEGHHPDYTKPLEVVWVCTPCHAEIHKNGE